jgi:light-regulated signal transduction histidine kinase (bacteriophytochrome)
MNDEAKSPLVIYRLELFQRVHGNSEFENTAADLATAQRSISRHGVRVGANAAGGAETAFHITLGDIR